MYEKREGEAGKKNDERRSDGRDVRTPTADACVGERQEMMPCLTATAARLDAGTRLALAHWALALKTGIFSKHRDEVAESGQEECTINMLNTRWALVIFLESSVR
jgi:hypothetical protein